MATKKAQYNVDNGNGYDTYHFETSEDMLVNIKQQQGLNGYRILPGGLIIQWGYITGVTYHYTTIQLPIAFSNNEYNIQLTSYWQGEFNALTVGEANVGSFRIARQNITSSDVTGNVYWFAIGY